MQRDELLSQRLNRRAFLRGAAALSASGAAVYAFGCGGGSEKSDSPTAAPASSPTPDAAAVTPVILTSEFVAGQRGRVLIGLLDSESDFVRDALVGLRFFTLAADGKTGTLRGEGPATYVELKVPAGASALGLENGDTIGFYTASAPFDSAGQWAVEISATPQDAAAPSIVQAAFNVFETYRIPAPGTVPPASQNDTAATNPNTLSICSRSPACPLHDKVIGDFLGKGRPLVVQFSTPAFCETRFCGPVLDVLLEQVPPYQDRIDFIHIEAWQDFQLKQYRAATREWGLPTEPITFFMGPDGKIASFLEAVFTQAELTAALDQLVAA